MRSGDKQFEGKITGGGLTDNVTVNLDNSMSASEIQALIDAQPKFIPYGFTLTFQFADGTYTLTDTLIFEGFYGGGNLYIYGNTGETAGLHTDQAVILDFTTTPSSGIYIQSCAVGIRVYHLRINISSAATYYGMRMVSCDYVTARYNYIIGTASTDSYAVRVVASNLWLDSTYVSAVSLGISCNLGRIYSRNNDDTGTQPAYGLDCVDAGTIGKNLTQPAGSTANERAIRGGVIR